MWIYNVVSNVLGKIMLAFITTPKTQWFNITQKVLIHTNLNAVDFWSSDSSSADDSIQILFVVTQESPPLGTLHRARRWRENTGGNRDSLKELSIV